MNFLCKHISKIEIIKVSIAISFLSTPCIFKSLLDLVSNFCLFFFNIEIHLILRNHKISRFRHSEYQKLIWLVNFNFDICQIDKNVMKHNMDCQLFSIVFGYCQNESIQNIFRNKSKCKNIIHCSFLATLT